MLQNSDHTGDTADAESNVADAELIAADSEPSDADRTDSVSRDNSVEKSLSQQMIKVENVEDEGLELTCVSVSENADHFNSDTEDESDNKNRGDQGQLGEGANVQADEMRK